MLVTSSMIVVLIFKLEHFWPYFYIWENFIITFDCFSLYMLVTSSKKHIYSLCQELVTSVKLLVIFTLYVDN